MLLFCQKAEFTQLPLENHHVAKLKSKCDQTPINHFQTKPILHFTFKSETVPLVLSFLNSLDHHANFYDMEESKEFYDSRFTDLTESRNAYLNHWQITTHPYRQESRTSQWFWNYESSDWKKEERTTM